MPVLPYCITEVNASSTIPRVGVAGAMVRVTDHAGLRCFFSEVESGQTARLSGQDAALEFHRVLLEVFRETAIIPFRFPAIVEEEPELLRFLGEHAAEYHQSLVALRNMVQMEIRIAAKDAIDQPATNSGQSGADYLRRKQQREAKLRGTADRIRSAVDTYVSDWRERDSAHDKRLFALVLRPSLPEFEGQLKNLEIEAENLVRVSGPWPPAEFLKKP